jgi:hypothetical protein
VAGPKILLVPEFTQVTWAIKPLLEEWADVASYDPPGIGDEPPPEAPTPELIRERFREGIIERGLAEVERRGWDRFMVAADGWGIASAARLARGCGEALAGVALGHATLSFTREGARPAINAEVHAAMTQLLSQDTKAFLRHGIPQATHGSVGPELAERMIERIPTEFLREGWLAITAEEPFGEDVVRLDCPMLLAKHEGCLMHTDEGFEDALAALPDAETVICEHAPSVDPGFAEAIRALCERIAAA